MERAPIHVLVVDDDEAVRQVIRRGFEREGFRVIEAADGPEAIERAAASPVDVAILDLHLPGMSGLDVLARLRDTDPDLHVIMLTGAGREEDRVLGLVSGADDYVVKPFSVRELAARVLAVQRRRVESPVPTIDIGGLHIDRRTRQVWIGESLLELTRREFDLLSHFAGHPGHTFSREELLNAVWGSSAAWQSPATVTEHVRRLRRKVELDPERPVRIITVRGSGYRFDESIAPLELTPTPEPSWAAGASADAVVVLVGTSVVHATTAAAELVGASDVEAVLGADVFDFVAQQSLGAATARHQSVQAGHRMRPDLITIRRLDGVERLVEVASTPVVWNGEQASQLTMWETSENPAALQELATGISTDVSDAVVITDAQLRIQRMNPAAEVLYGWTEDEAIGRASMEVIPWLHDELLIEDAREAFQRDGHWHAEVVQQRRDGSPVTVNSTSTLLRDSAGRPVGVVSVNRPVKESWHRGASADEASLVAEIRRGIDQDEFEVHYQPVTRLADGSWSGVEALVRWQHPERGLLLPAEFIDAAERSGAIVELGQRVIEHACRDLAGWSANGTDLDLAINLSGRQLADPALPERLRQAMESAGVPEGKLWLEVTETSLVEDLEHAKEHLRAIEKLGVRIAIDDFGTGWASLTYLREFPVHALKIDRLFVQGLGTSTTDAAIVSSVIRLARELDLVAIAEGVETAGQLAHLTQLGCELGQGYLFGRPSPLSDLGLDQP